MSKLLAEMISRRDTEQQALDALLATVEADSRTALSAEEDTAFGAHSTELDTLDASIARLSRVEAGRQAAADAAVTLTPTASVTVGNEPTTYGRGGANSYFLDLARLGRGDVQAHARLNRHAVEAGVDLGARGGTAGAFEAHAGSRTDGQGGYFVPPLWLIDDYIDIARNGRPFANAVTSIPLPGGTDSISLPKIATGTQVGPQSEGGAVLSVDLTDTSVSAPVRTIAGQMDVSMQLLDQSPIAFDQIVFADLLADYAYRLDQACLTGTGTGDQIKGIDSVSGVNTITYTDATPTIGELYPAFGQALSQIAANRKRQDGVSFWMHPRRWNWLLTQLDSSGRPFIVNTARGPVNSLASVGGSVSEGPVGEILGVPVNLDLSIPTTKTAGVGTSGTEDVIYAVRTPDVFLFEGALRTRALFEVLSGTLQVRLQVFNYLAFLPDRLPKAIATISGTGLAAPAGF